MVLLLHCATKCDEKSFVMPLQHATMATDNSAWLDLGVDLLSMHDGGVCCLPPCLLAVNTDDRQPGGTDSDREGSAGAATGSSTLVTHTDRLSCVRIWIKNESSNWEGKQIKLMLHHHLTSSSNTWDNRQNLNVSTNIIITSYYMYMY